MSASGWLDLLRSAMRATYWFFYPPTLLVLLALTITHRFAEQFLLVTGLICYLVSFARPTGKYALVVLAAAVVLLFSPLDLCTPRDRRFSYTAGKVGIRPLIIGFPTNKTLERAKRGEVVLGGCIGSGLDPEYVVTW